VEFWQQAREMAGRATLALSVPPGIATLYD